MFRSPPAPTLPVFCSGSGRLFSPFPRRNHNTAGNGAITPIPATTLEQLSLAVMTEQATAIVRAKVVGLSTAVRAGDVYTNYQLETLESLKTPHASIRQVSVPGGVAGGIRQTMAGA